MAFHDVLEARGDVLEPARHAGAIVGAAAHVGDPDAYQGGHVHGFGDLFDPEEGRMGVAVTFIAMLELLRESVIEVVQSDEFAPLHVRAASSVRLVTDDDPGGISAARGRDE